MTIWKTAPITEQPELSLSHWRIFQLEDGSRYFNGFVYQNREGRVSSKIVTFDKESMSGITASGRVYSLVGPKGYDSDADYVLGRWLAINSLSRSDIKFVENNL